MTYINTSNILFIASGAFVGIEQIIKNRLNKGHSHVGFNATKHETYSSEELKSLISPEDIRDFGFIPEFVGRFPIITCISKLGKDDLKRILTEPKNSIIHQYIELLDMDNTELSFDNAALDEMADIASHLGTGARALRNIAETVMTDIMFDAPNNKKKRQKVKLTITKEDVVKKTQKKFRLAC